MSTDGSDNIRMANASEISRFQNAPREGYFARAFLHVCSLRTPYFETRTVWFGASPTSPT